MSQVIDELNAIAKRMEKGTAKIEEVDRFKYLSCQQLIINMNIAGTKELVELERAKLNATIDSMAVLLFGEQWKWEPKLIVVNVEKENESLT